MYKYRILEFQACFSGVYGCASVFDLKFRSQYKHIFHFADTERGISRYPRKERYTHAHRDMVHMNTTARSMIFDSECIAKRVGVVQAIGMIKRLQPSQIRCYDVHIAIWIRHGEQAQLVKKRHTNSCYLRNRCLLLPLKKFAFALALASVREGGFVSRFWRRGCKCMIFSCAMTESPSLGVML